MSNTPSSLELIIFDLDGTVLDTIGDLAGAVRFALEKNGFPPRTDAEVTRFVGNGVRKLIERALPAGNSDPETVDRVLNDFNIRYGGHFADLTRPFDGIPEALDRLKALGFKLAVLSNKPDEFTKALIGRFFPKKFDAVLGSGENTPRKPDPTGELSIISGLGLSTEQCIHIGDSDTDVATAHNAGLKCIGCTWGYRSKSVLEAAGADLIVENPGDIPKIFEKTVEK